MTLPLGWPIAATPVRETYEFTRLEELQNMPVVAMGLAIVLCAILAYTWIVYRCESSSVSPFVSWLLTFLRTVSLGGVIVLALDLVKREAKEIVEPSRVVILADTSKSMGMPSATPSSIEVSSRSEEMFQFMARSEFISELIKRHTVEIVRFAELAEQVAAQPAWGQDERGDVEADPVRNNLLDLASLQPTGGETRMGGALQAVLQRLEGYPLSGIVVLSDGGQNAGIDPMQVATTAKEREVAVHTIGFGPLRLPPNLIVRDLIAPKRVYPGDRMTIAGVLEAHALDVPTTRIELLRQRDGADETAWKPIGDQTVELELNGSSRVEFATTSEESGQYIYELRVPPVGGETTTNDNSQRVTVSVVDRKLRVLLVAGGPSKEYQFLRNQLHRDKNVTLDVWLQSAGEGAAQDAEAVLTEFPDTREKLFEYDAIVAFDPDWSTLNSEALNFLESWVAEQAGGMIVAPGPIKTRSWVQNPSMGVMRTLYPVVFDPNEVELASSAESNEDPSPLQLTREGVAAEFLWLSDDAQESADSWDEFSGVYGVQAGIAGTKPGSTVYARMLVPRQSAQLGDDVFMAEQFYGSGRVFFLNSAELWRLRSMDPAYFERIYAKLVQHVSQGRLQRGSSRGSLFAERDRYELGDTIVLRTRLLDAQLQPLQAEDVELQILLPDERVESLRLRADPAQLGNYVGDFRAIQEGTYLINLTIPDSEESLKERIRVELPVLEQQPLVRNEGLLKQIAANGGGTYYGDPAIALHGTGDTLSLADSLLDRSETRIIYSQPDEEFAKMMRIGLLCVICGALFSEWMVRRWNRLA